MLNQQPAGFAQNLDQGGGVGAGFHDPNDFVPDQGAGFVNNMSPGQDSPVKGKVSFLHPYSFASFTLKLRLWLLLTLFFSDLSL